MNYIILCSGEKEAYDLFLATVKQITPIKVNMKLKKVILDNHVYSFAGHSSFNEFLKRNFTGQTMTTSQFYEKYFK